MVEATTVSHKLPVLSEFWYCMREIYHEHAIGQYFCGKTDKLKEVGSCEDCKYKKRDVYWSNQGTVRMLRQPWHGLG